LARSDKGVLHTDRGGVRKKNYNNDLGLDHHQ